MIIGLFLVLPILLVISLYDRIEEQQTAQRKLLVRMQAFQAENGRIAEQLIEQVKAERLKLNEDRILVSEMIVALAEQMAAAPKAEEAPPQEPMSEDASLLSEETLTEEESKFYDELEEQNVLQMVFGLFKGKNKCEGGSFTYCTF